jgi:hypothetical protein
MSNDQEWWRLQELYAALGDGELLRLAGAKDGLTAVAQQAMDAEMKSRGLELPVEEHDGVSDAAAELSGAEGDPSLVELMTFQIAMDAETALHALDDADIPVRMEPAMRRLVEGGPVIKTNWLTIFVERTRKDDAVKVLRARMGLFPVLAADEVDDSEGPDDGEDSLAVVGSFQEAVDAEVAQKALTDAGIWFKADGDDEGTMVEVRPEDLERALEAVEEAFSEAD